MYNYCESHQYILFVAPALINLFIFISFPLLILTTTDDVIVGGD